jgi:leader peptidase (prepilin peptidase)/N-methyltransferase
MGMGDVKLGGVLGAAAGLVGIVAAVASPVAAFIGGGVAGISAIRRGPGGSIPFGPFMLAGFWAAVVLAGLGS